MKKNRIICVDSWRGLAIVLMVLYHLLYDLKFMFNQKLGFFTIESWYPIQQYICWSFIFLAGFSMNLSKKPLKNGLKVFAAALVLTVITSLATPEFSIKFGVLHLLGISMLILTLFPKGEKCNSFRKGLAFFLLFFFIWKVGLEKLSFYKDLANTEILFPLGFASSSFSSSDYFPLLPWFFLFLSGYYLGNYNKYKNQLLEKIKIKENILAKIGRHSFEIYLAHQVVIYSILKGLEYLGII